MEPCPVPKVARRQAGVFTAGQAMAEGWTGRQVKRRVASGRWVPVAGRGLAGPADFTARQYATAAALTWPSAVISHRTAAALHGYPVDHPPGADVLAMGRRGPRNLRVHAIPCAPSETARVFGLAVTSRRRTAVDCLATMHGDEALRLWAWVSSRRILDHLSLLQEIERRQHRYGTPALRWLADVVAGGAVSPAEKRLHDLLHDNGVTGWSAGQTVRDADGVIGVVDVLFAAARVVIEVDGYAAHAGRSAFESDRRRQNRLVMSGYAVLRFTWTDLTTRPAAVVDEIRAALAGAGEVRGSGGWLVGG